MHLVMLYTRCMTNACARREGDKTLQTASSLRFVNNTTGGEG